MCSIQFYRVSSSLLMYEALRVTGVKTFVQLMNYCLLSGSIFPLLLCSLYLRTGFTCVLDRISLEVYRE